MNVPARRKLIALPGRPQRWFPAFLIGAFLRLPALVDYIGPHRTASSWEWERLACHCEAVYDPPSPGKYGFSLTSSVQGYFNSAASGTADGSVVVSEHHQEQKSTALSQACIPGAVKSSVGGSRLCTCDGALKSSTPLTQRKAHSRGPEALWKGEWSKVSLRMKAQRRIFLQQAGTPGTGPDGQMSAWPAKAH